MAILGLDAVNRFFESLRLGWIGFWNVWAVLGLAIIFVLLQGLTIWLYAKIIRAMVRFKPRVEQFIRNVLLYFD